jgi:hypothetical protein
MWTKQKIMPKTRWILIGVLWGFAEIALCQERPIEERLLQKTPEAILQKKNPALANTLLNKQKYLVLDKAGKVKRLRFFVGDPIKFRLWSGGRKHKGEIASIGDSTFGFLIHNDITNRFEYQHFRVSDVRSVSVSRRIPFISAASYMAPLAGVGLMALDVINSRGTGPGWLQSGVVKTGGSLIAFGGVGQLLSRRTYRLRGYKRLRVLQSF